MANSLSSDHLDELSKRRLADAEVLDQVLKIYRQIRVDPRPEQLALTVGACQSFLNGKKFVALEAPTGLGKSIIAIVVSLWCQMIGDRKSYILTPTNQLQDQYTDSHVCRNGSSLGTLLHSYRGPRNFTCPFYKASGGKDAHCNVAKHHEFTVSGQDKDEGDYCPGCEYEQQRRTAVDAPMVVTSYSAFLHTVVSPRLFGFPNSLKVKRGPVDFGDGEGVLLQPRPLLILDEAHTALDFLRQYLTVTIDSEEFREEAQWVKGDLGEPESRNAARRLARHALSLEYEPTYLPHMVQKLLLYGDLKKTNHWTHSNENGRLLLKPLNMREAVNRFFSKFSSRTLLMSSTMSRKLVTEGFGISERTSRFFTSNHSTPPARRPVIVIGDGWDMRGGGKVEGWRRELPHYLPYVETIIRAFKGYSGVIHTASYKHARALAAAIATRLDANDDGHTPSELQDLYKILNRWRLTTGHKMYYVDSSNREELLEVRQVLRTTDMILIGPGMAEGIDLPDELASFQVVTKVPYGDLGDPHEKTKLRSKYGDWYNWNASSAVVQASGRAVRHKDDWAMTFVLDKAFQREMRTVDNFPEWYSEAIKDVQKDHDTIKEEIAWMIDRYGRN